MAFDLKELRLERVDIDVAYHAAFTFFGLKGALMERWGHGPIFGAYGELGSGQVNLSPAGDSGDTRITAVAGLRASGLVGEGPKWASSALDIGPDWLDDVYAVLKPKRTVLLKVELLGLHPVSNPMRASKRLREHYYQPAALQELQEAAVQHAALDMFNVEEDGSTRSLIMGVIGPHHRGYFTFTETERDSKWWMGLKLIYARQSDDGIFEPLDALKSYLDRGAHEFQRVARSAFPQLVSD